MHRQNQFFGKPRTGSSCAMICPFLERSTVSFATVSRILPQPGSVKWNAREKAAGSGPG